MKKLGLVNKMNLAIGKMKLGAKRRSPEILLIAGVIGVVTSGVLACAATTKLDEILDKSKDDIDKIKEFAPEEKGYTVNDYSDEDREKDVAIVKVKTAANIAKLYAPAVLLGGLSITSIIGGHYILHERNVALAAALASAAESLKQYRSRVAEKIGDEAEKKLYYNIVDETVIDENGKEAVITKIGDEVISGGTRYVFDASNPNYEDEGDYNISFLRIQCSHLNNRLQAYGYLFLNDVLDSIGAPRCKEGQVLGWIYEPDNKNRANYIDFGEIETRDAILLDFNCDGNILTDFEKHGRWQ